MKTFHLTGLIYLLRHGEKASDGSLTLLGHHQAALKAMESHYLDGNIHIFHSGSERVLKSAVMFSEYLNTTHSTLDQPRAHIDAHLESIASKCKVTEGIKNELHYLYDPKVGGSYYSTWNQPISNEDANHRIQDLLNLEDQSPDPGIALSPLEMAKSVAKVVLEQITSSESTPFNVRGNYINGSHEPVISAFLYYMITDLRGNNPSFISDIAGRVGYAEGPTISIYQNEDQEIMLQMTFRNYLVSFKKQDLENFVMS